MINNVSSIVNQEICCSCGACAEVCAKRAISFSYKQGIFAPKINEALCINCKLCVEVCPSAYVDVHSVFGTPDLFSDEEKECYVAFSTNEKLRHLGTSGGVVSTMIYELLRKGLFKKAYVLNYEKFDGKQAIISSISNPDDVFGSVKSKYIPASIAEVVKDINNGTFAQSIVVATPCQLLAIRKSLLIKKNLETSNLFIGLFCDKTLNYNIYGYYQEKYGKYDFLHFRDKEGNGWPGDTVLGQQGGKIIVDKQVRMSLKPYFQLNRCRFCFDKLNQLADISCGDCYIDGEQTQGGKSSIVIRTKKGKDAFQECVSVLNFKESCFRDIKESQHLEMKRENYKRNLSDGCPFTLPDAEESLATFDRSRDIEIEKIQMGANATSAKDYRKIENSISKANIKPRPSKLKRYCKRLKKLFHNPDCTVKVLIDNAGFVNKGAELMLRSVVQQLEMVTPKVRIVVPEKVFYENLNYCYQHHILPLHLVYGGKKKVIKHYLYNNLLNKPWFITPDQINVVLDAGGFQFGDQWNPSESTIAWKRKYYSSFTKQNRRIIFLPQAFGSFEQPLAKQLMREVYNVADLLYAREPVSYQYLKTLFPDDEKKIKLAPDFTCLSHGDNVKMVQLSSDYVVLVPNVRMITHTQQDVSFNYFDFLYELSKFLLEKEESLVLLNHEGNDDLQILLKLGDRLPKNALILSNLDALEVKRIIGGAKLLVSSRFHGVVSGLTQGVPTLCTSWSHKYLELLREHGCDQSVLSVEHIEQAKQLIEEALDNPSKFVSKKGCTDEIKRKSVQMWKEVLSLISLS